MIKGCAICGKQFDTTGRSRAVTCGAECAVLYAKNRASEYESVRRCKARRKKKERDPNYLALARVNAEARALGLSYGQYVGYMNGQGRI